MVTYCPWLIGHPGILGVYANITHPLQEAVQVFESNGVFVDKTRLTALAEDYRKSIYEAEELFWKQAGRMVRYNVPSDLSAFLYEELKLPVLLRTDKNAPSTAIPALEKLKDHHPAVKTLVELKRMVKLKKDFLDGMGASKGLLPWIQHDGRIHSTYRIDGTESGRLSSAGPNLQNIPRASDIRSMFRPEPGNLWIEADYSQLELRIAANLSGDVRMIEAFESGADFHALTASMMFHVSLDEVTKAQRSIAKAVNFGVLYGMGPYSLAFRLDIDPEEAEQYITSWFGTYKGVWKWLRRNFNSAQNNGYVDTVFGRRRHLPELNSNASLMMLDKKRKEYLKRVANNFPIQSTGSDILSLSTISLINHPFDEFVDTGAFPIMTLHDALYFEAPKGNAADAAYMIKTVMENVPKEVLGKRWKIPAEVKISKYWGQDPDKDPEDYVVLH